MSVSCSPPSGGQLSPQALYRPYFRPFTYQRPRPRSGPFAQPSPRSDVHPGRRLPLTPPVCRSRPRLSWRTRGRQNFERDWTRRWGERWADVEGIGEDNDSHSQDEMSTDSSRSIGSGGLTTDNDEGGSTEGESSESERESVRICGICLETPRETFWCPHCLHPWCTSCITRWSAASPNSSCPNCRRSLEVATEETSARDRGLPEHPLVYDTEISPVRFGSCEAHSEELMYFDLRRNQHVCATCVLEQRQARSTSQDTIDSTSVNYFSQPYMPQLYMGNALRYTTNHEDVFYNSE